MHLLQKSLGGPKVKCAFFNETTSLLNCILKQTLFPKMDHNFWKIVEKHTSCSLQFFCHHLKTISCWESCLTLINLILSTKLYFCTINSFLFENWSYEKGRIPFHPNLTVIKSFKWKISKLCNTKWAFVSQGGNFMIFVSLKFYVRSIPGVLEVQNLPI